MWCGRNHKPPGKRGTIPTGCRLSHACRRHPTKQTDLCPSNPLFQPSDFLVCLSACLPASCDSGTFPIANTSAYCKLRLGHSSGASAAAICVLTSTSPALIITPYRLLIIAGLDTINTYIQPRPAVPLNVAVLNRLYSLHSRYFSSLLPAACHNYINRHTNDFTPLQKYLSTSPP